MLPGTVHENAASNSARTCIFLKRHICRNTGQNHVERDVSNGVILHGNHSESCAKTLSRLEHLEVQRQLQEAMERIATTIDSKKFSTFYISIHPVKAEGWSLDDTPPTLKQWVGS